MTNNNIPNTNKKSNPVNSVTGNTSISGDTSKSKVEASQVGDSDKVTSPPLTEQEKDLIYKYQSFDDEDGFPPLGGYTDRDYQQMTLDYINACASGDTSGMLSIGNRFGREARDCIRARQE